MDFPINFCTFVIVIEITIATVGFGSAHLNKFSLRSPCTTVVIKERQESPDLDIVSLNNLTL